MGLNYSQEARYNRSLMVPQKIVFYVEDDGKEYEYEIIFEKLFSIKGTYFFVCSLGGKQNVYETYYKNLTRKSNKTFLYIVDGDFDIIINKFEISANNFLYLDRYNIENYFVCENAIIEYFRLEKGIIYEKAQSIIQYNDWYNKICKKLSKLFYYFLYIYWLKMDESPITVSDGEGQYFDHETGDVLDEKINIKINELIQYVKQHGIDHDKKFDEFNNCYKNVFFSNCEHYICGKYLLHGLCFYLIYLSKKNNLLGIINIPNLKKYLVDHININYFSSIVTKFSPYVISQIDS